MFVGNGGEPFFWASLSTPVGAGEAPRLRIMPPDGSIFAAHQRFDLRIEGTGSEADKAPQDLRVFLDGREITSENVALDTADGRTAKNTANTMSAMKARPRSRNCAASVRLMPRLLNVCALAVT